MLMCAQWRLGVSANQVVHLNSEKSSLAALPYLTQSEEQRAREEPEVAFVECTAHQVEIHATEVLSRSRVAM